MASSDANVPRTRHYQPFSKGPWVVFFRPKNKPLNTLTISRDLLRKHPGILIYKERFNKLRVEAPNYEVANKIADHEVFSIEYNIYIPSRDVEIEGVVSDASLTVEDLKLASGCFKNSMMSAELVRILDVRQLHYSASMQDGKKVYQHSNSFRVTFAGSVLPNFVKLDGAFFPVRLFEQRVFECTNCKRLGHTASHCSNKFRCGKCGENHKEDSCTQAAEKCIHCGENPPHPLQSCPMYKQRADKVKRSIIGRSKQTYAQMVKSASAAQDGNQFLILSAEESDSDLSDEGDSTVVHVPSKTGGSSKRKCSSPKVRRKKTKVTPRRLQNYQGNGDEKTKPKAPAAPIPGCSKDFPPLPRKDNNNKHAAPQVSQKKSKSDGGLLAFSDIVEFILNLFNIQDPLRSLVSALLPTVESYLKKLTVSWPLLASIISFDG